MRKENWRECLIEYLSSAARLSHQDGVHDCALNTASAVCAMTGMDYAAPYRGRYTTFRGGIRILRKDGFADHIALAAHHLKEKPVAFAQPGDVAVVDVPEGPSLGIVQGETIYVLGVDGVATVPLTTATRCFEV